MNYWHKLMRMLKQSAHRSVIAGLATCLLLSSCAYQRRIERDVQYWLDCTDCADAYLERIDGYGERALPPLLQVVTAPSAVGDRELTRKLLRERYEKLAAYAWTGRTKLEWASGEEYADYYERAADIPRLRAAYTILIICQGPGRCKQLQPLLARLPDLQVNFISDEARRTFLRIAAQYPKE